MMNASETQGLAQVITAIMAIAAFAALGIFLVNRQRSKQRG
jgi:hypothetical protein